MASQDYFNLAYQSALGSDKEKSASRETIRKLCAEQGIFSASILPLYRAMSKGEVGGFTVPAINIRTLTYDTARAALRAAKSRDAGAIIFEIARTEIGYTDQSPDEYSTIIMAAALKEGWRGPLFIQGDHFQASAKVWRTDPKKETGALEDLIGKAVAAGFYNIDIDASTLVDLSQPTVEKQQDPNVQATVHFIRFIQGINSAGASISIGGEIGEVGGKNSTEEELDAFLDGVERELGKGALSKISVQTGTAHGGVVLPDGSLAKVSIDFDTLKRMSRKARQRGLAGAVQHGASTLPEDAFHHFPESECAEIHLATGFQNFILDHPALSDLSEKVSKTVQERFSKDRGKEETDAQFLYKTRKKVFGPLKKTFWDLPSDTREEIGKGLEGRFGLIFDKLRIKGTRKETNKWVTA